MAIFPHIIIHFLLSLSVSYLMWRKWRHPLLSFFGAILGGIAVDADHFVDYFLAFGKNLQLDYFLYGFQFLKSGRVYIPFHAWEYVIILIILAVTIKNDWTRIFLFSLALSLFFHLGADSVINEGMKLQSYSLLYRMKKGFDVEKIVTEDHFEKYKEQRELIELEK